MSNGRIVSIIGITTVIVAFSGIVIATLIRGGPVALQAPSIVGLFAFLSTLAGLLVTIVRVESISGSINDIQSKVNGHLAIHEQATATAQQALTEARAAEETKA